MSKHMAYVYFVTIEVDRGYQAVLIPANIEDDQISYFVNRRKSGAKLPKVGEVGFLHNPEPACKRNLTIRVISPKLAQALPRNNMHLKIISHLEMLCKMRKGCPLVRLDDDYYGLQKLLHFMAWVSWFPDWLASP